MPALREYARLESVSTGSMATVVGYPGELFVASPRSDAVETRRIVMGAIFIRRPVSRILFKSRVLRASHRYVGCID